ncbi:MAG: prolyl oligopeptidase family serine peptidase [Cytophagaceae bacterium]|nr:prolyl oligopeptidase family serine peptidase [Gemmatimonadaceae bacterium]
MRRHRSIMLAALAVLAMLGLAGPVAAQKAGRHGTVRTDTLWSQALGVRKQVVVWLPPSYTQEASLRYPVAYYLHGLWGDETNWLQLGKIDATLDSLMRAGLPEMIVVMPDGDDGWWTTWNTLGDFAACRRTGAADRKEPADSYCVPWPHYDDYVARDLVQHVDRSYRTRADRAHRGIAGLSMGGYGALSIAFAYPDIFTAAASHSGVLSPLLGGRDTTSRTTRYASNGAQLREGWGPRFWGLIAPAFGTDTAAWWSRDPGRRATRLAATRRALLPRLFIDVGTDDGLLEQSRDLRATLQRAGIAHDYAEHPGAHDWDYWRKHVAASAAWMSRVIGAP